MKFFGAAIAGRRKVKLKVAQPKLKEIEVWVGKMIFSSLFTVHSDDIAPQKSCERYPQSCPGTDDKKIM
jgi:hypothetical protein